jgi:hypothetical protein
MPIPCAQHRRDQFPGVGIIDHQRMIHILVVVPVEKRQLLIAIGGVIGAVKIQDDSLGFPLLVPPDIQDLQSALLSGTDLSR